MTVDEPSTASRIMSEFLSVIGWVPAFVFPAASVLQLLAIARRGRSDGVSRTTWSLFAFANVCLYLTIGEWTRPQVVITTLGTAALQVVVVVLAVRLRSRRPDKGSSRRSGPPPA